MENTQSSSINQVACAASERKMGKLLHPNIDGWEAGGKEWSSGGPSSRKEVTSDQDYPTFSHAAAADPAAEVDIRNNPGLSICAGSHFPLFPDRTFTKRTQRGYNDPIRVLVRTVVQVTFSRPQI